MPTRDESLRSIRPIDTAPYQQVKLKGLRFYVTINCYEVRVDLRGAREARRSQSSLFYESKLYRPNNPRAAGKLPIHRQNLSHLLITSQEEDFMCRKDHILLITGALCTHHFPPILSEQGREPCRDRLISSLTGPVHFFSPGISHFKGLSMSKEGGDSPGVLIGAEAACYFGYCLYDEFRCWGRI